MYLPLVRYTDISYVNESSAHQLYGLALKNK